MTDGVNDWAQEGRMLVWRYAEARRGWRGWHFTADPVGCRSIRSLFDRMSGGGSCHRTLRLSPVTEAVLRVPNYGHKIAGRFEKVRIEYRPEFGDLSLSADGTALTMRVGDKRLPRLTEAFADVEVGNGDFGIGTSDVRRSEVWMFWWMPGRWSGQNLISESI